LTKLPEIGICDNAIDGTIGAGKNYEKAFEWGKATTHVELGDQDAALLPNSEKKGYIFHRFNFSIGHTFSPSCTTELC
jgi:hypothetical protein